MIRFLGFNHWIGNAVGWILYWWHIWKENGTIMSLENLVWSCLVFKSFLVNNWRDEWFTTPFPFSFCVCVCVLYMAPHLHLEIIWRSSSIVLRLLEHMQFCSSCLMQFNIKFFQYAVRELRLQLKPPSIQVSVYQIDITYCFEQHMACSLVR